MQRHCNPARMLLLLQSGLMRVSALCSDNLIYYSYVAFKTYEDLKDHLKQEATKKFIKCALQLMTVLHPDPLLLPGAVRLSSQGALHAGGIPAMSRIH